MAEQSIKPTKQEVSDFAVVAFVGDHTKLSPHTATIVNLTRHTPLFYFVPTDGHDSATLAIKKFHPQGEVSGYTSIAEVVDSLHTFGNLFGNISLYIITPEPAAFADQNYLTQGRIAGIYLPEEAHQLENCLSPTQ